MEPIVSDIGTPPAGNRFTAYFRTNLTVNQDYDNLVIEIFADDGVLYIDAESDFSSTDDYHALAKGLDEANTRIIPPI